VIEVRPGRPGWAAVTFRHPAEAETVAVVGDFNQWERGTLDLRPDGEGRCSGSVELPIGRRYRFRYLVDGDRWENDWDADDYEANEHGGDDAVLDLRHDGPHADRLGIGDSRLARAQRHEPGSGRDTTL
jgi:1,4-alpha-glucan branching enzyme